MGFSKLLILLFISISAGELFASKPEYTYKLVLIGDPGVGKTTLLDRAMSRTVNPKYTPSSNIEKGVFQFCNDVKNYKTIDNVFVIPGSAVNDDNMLKELSDADAVWFVYNDYDSFKNICLQWCPIVEKYCKNGTLLELIQNKSENVKSTQLPSKEEIESLEDVFGDGPQCKINAIKDPPDLIQNEIMLVGFELWIRKDVIILSKFPLNASRVLKQHTNNNDRKCCCF